jgi:hypothetical protein
MLHLWPHYAGRHGHAFPSGQSYTINRLWPHYAGKHSHISQKYQSHTLNPSSLATLCRQTWSYFPNRSILYYKSFISGHIMPANMVILPQQLSPTPQIFICGHTVPTDMVIHPPEIRSSSRTMLCAVGCVTCIYELLFELIGWLISYLGSWVTVARWLSCALGHQINYMYKKNGKGNVPVRIMNACRREQWFSSIHS